MNLRYFSIPIFAILCGVSIKALALEASDDFMRLTTSGTALDAQNVGKSDLQWEATPNLLTKNGNIVFTNSNNGVAKIPLKGDWKAITVQGNVWPRKSSADKDTWLAVGIGNPSKLTDIQWSEGILVLLHSSGFFECYYSNGNKLSKIGDGNVVNFEHEGFNTLQLTYHKDAQTVSVSINGTAYIENSSLSALNAVIKVDSVGFSGSGQPVLEPSFGKFSIKTTP